MKLIAKKDGEMVSAMSCKYLWVIMARLNLTASCSNSHRIASCRLFAVAGHENILSQKK